MTRTSNISTAEVEFIKRNYRDMADDEIAVHLGRPIGSITRKRQRLGLFHVQQVLEGCIVGEQWKPFHSHCGHYQISNKGRVKAGRKLMAAFINSLGYCQIRVSNFKGTSKSYKCHRLVAEAFCPKPEGWAPDWHVHHKDLNPTNNSSENLEWLPEEEHLRLHHP